MEKNDPLAIMAQVQVLRMFREVGALISDDHLVYASGKHGSDYFDKDRMYPHTHQISRLCQSIAMSFAGSGVEAVVAPEKGGIILSQWVAYHLSEMTGREVLAFYAEKTEEGGFIIKRGNARAILPGKKVLVVEDVLTTGGSVKKVIEAVIALGCELVGLGVLCNRGQVKPEDVANPARMVALLDLALPMYDEADCPFCKEGRPINTVLGKGKEYLAKKAQSG